MADTIFFITDHSVQVDVLHTAEDILLNVRILLAKFPDQILDLRALGTLLRTAAGSTAFRPPPAIPYGCIPFCVPPPADPLPE